MSTLPGTAAPTVTSPIWSANFTIIENISPNGNGVLLNWLIFIYFYRNLFIEINYTSF